MRIALKIAYDGSAFFGHQRQPDRRTVEGECLLALQSARIIRNPTESFFRSASRTDRGVSAMGNVIAFTSSLNPQAILGAFNDRARGVWAWAWSAVPDSFHPRHAEERWYRYYLLDPIPIGPLRRAAAVFEGEHDFRRFISEASSGPRTVRRVDVTRKRGVTVIDVRGRSFRRGMIRRIVSALVAYAKGDVRLAEIRAALRGEEHDFGVARPEALVLMDVQYDISFSVILKPKVLADWREIRDDLGLRAAFFRDLSAAVGTERH